MIRNLILFADDTSLSIRKNNNIDLTNQFNIGRKFLI